MGTVTVNLQAAGLTHAKSQSDLCDGEHDIDIASVVYITDPGWVPAEELADVLQALHVQAHPQGTAYWDKCCEPSCRAAQDLLSDDCTAPAARPNPRSREERGKHR
jgi:hypothetical protein